MALTEAQVVILYFLDFARIMVFKKEYDRIELPLLMTCNTFGIRYSSVLGYWHLWAINLKGTCKFGTVPSRRLDTTHFEHIRNDKKSSIACWKEISLIEKVSA